MSDHIMDWAREARIGLPEAVYGSAKTVAQLDALCADALAQGRRLLITRLSPAAHAALAPAHRAALDYAPLSQTGILGDLELPARATVGIVSAGLGDLPVAEEAARVLAFSGVRAELITDVGVAGLWRLLDRIEQIRLYPVLIACAGMEGALFSVLGGLVSAPIIAVPTPVGEGVAAGGQAALSSALASCAPGIVAVNIGNGFGAAQAAIRMLRLAGLTGQAAAPVETAGASGGDI